VACVVGGIRLFSAPSNAADNPASLRGSQHASLTPVTGRQHRYGRPRASVSATPSPSPIQVDGQQVTAVGDSVMVASTPVLQRALPGIYIDAAVGRQFSTGLQVIADLKARGLLRPIVVVGLGTNGTVTRDEISQLFSEIGPNRELVLVNTYEARPWEQEVNSTLAAAAADHAHVALANWFRTIENRTYLLWPDGIHPQPSGCIVYAKMLKAALERLVNSSG
jgi:hypothetical protein